MSCIKCEKILTRLWCIQEYSLLWLRFVISTDQRSWDLYLTLLDHHSIFRLESVLYFKPFFTFVVVVVEEQNWVRVDWKSKCPFVFQGLESYTHYDESKVLSLLQTKAQGLFTTAHNKQVAREKCNSLVFAPWDSCQLPRADLWRLREGSELL